MTAAARFRKLALTAHVVASVGWLGSVVAFLTLAITGRASGDPELVRGELPRHGGRRVVRNRPLVADAAAAIVLLLVAATLSVFKPARRTRYGWRKLRRDS